MRRIIVVALLLLSTLSIDTTEEFYTYLPLVARSHCAEGETMSDWKIIVPQLTTNLETNPSFEIGTAGWSAVGTNTVAQSAVRAKFGLYSLLCTNGNSNVMAQDTITLTVGQTYKLTAWVYVPSDFDMGNGEILRIDPTNFAGATEVTNVAWIKGTDTEDAWKRIESTLTIAADAVGEFSISYSGGAVTAGRTMNVDAVQIELGNEVTTFCDGTQKGCEWNGAEHASTSTRSAVSRAGGLVRDLQDDYFLNISAVIGAGTPPQVDTLSSYALLPGGELNSIKVASRTITFVGTITGTSQANLNARKQALIEVLSPTAYPPDADGIQPVRLRYTGAAVVKQFDVHYERGLEGALRWSEPCGWERLAIRFVAPDPFWYEIGESAQLLDSNDSATFRVVSARLKSTGQWDVLGPPAVPGIAVYSEVRDIVIGNDKIVYMGGRFTNFNNDADADRIVQWDGSTWSWPAGEGVDDNSVFALLFGPDGILYAAGDFTAVSGAQPNTNGIATWTGAAWVALGTSSDDFSVDALAIDQSGNIYAGGAFTGMGGVLNTNRIAMWDGAAWNALSNGIDNLSIRALAVGLDGIVYAGGTFTLVDGGSPFIRIAHWNGTAWASMGDANGTVFALAVNPSDGTLYAGGNFTTIGGISSGGMAKWNGTSWTDISSGLAVVPVVRAIEIAPDGFIYVGGIVVGRAAKGSGNGGDWVQLDLEFAGGATVYTFAIGEPDAVIFNNYDIYVGHDQAVAIPYAGIATVTEDGTAPAYPKFVVERSGGTSAVLETLRNETTGLELLFDYALLDGEILTIDLAPTSKSVVSNFFGPRPDAILPNSDFGAWSLLPGDNPITCFVSVGGGATVTAYLLWRDTHLSFD